MYCPKCGSQLPNNSQFCGACGFNMQQGAPAPQPQQQMPQQPQPNPQPQYQQPNQMPQQQYQMPQQQYNMQPQQQVYNPAAYGGAAAVQPKKKSKAPLIILIVVAVFAVFAILGVACKTVISKAIMGEVGYYAVAEAETMSQILKNDEFAKLLETEDFSVDADGTVAFMESEEGKLQLKGGYSGEDDKATAKLTLLGDSADDNMDIIINMGNGKLGVETNGETTTIPLSPEVNTDEFSELVTKIYPIIKDAEKAHLADGISTSKEEIDGISCKVTTFSVKESDLLYAVADVLEAAQGDEEIMESIKKVLEDNAALISQFSDEFSGKTASEIYSELTTSIPTAITSLRSEADALVAKGDTTMFTYKVAYKNKKEILQRQFSAGDTSFTIKTIINGDVATVSYTKDSNNNVMYVRTIDGGKTTIQLTGVIDGISFSATGSDLETETVNGVAVPIGTINFAFSDVSSGKITMTADDRFHINAEYYTGEGKALDAKLNFTLSDKADLSDYKEPAEPDSNSASDFSSFFDM
ncbi:MAG: zinc ribbon domain-containing protein [Eubacterium sp.]|nr:zinc ribbon domain-containing protein [Eubacterium sp.]